MREYTERMSGRMEKVEDGWLWFGIVDRGPRYRDPVTGRQKEFIGKDGRPYIGLLNGKGGALNTGEDLHILWFQREEVKTDT